MITKVHLTEIEARANAATAGPWTYHEEDRGVPYVLGPSTNPAIGSPNVVATTRYSDRFMKDDRDNMRFCAHAREDIPALIAALREERKREERAEAALLRSAPHCQGGHSEAGQAIAEVLGIPFPVRMDGLRQAAEQLWLLTLEPSNALAAS